MSDFRDRPVSESPDVVPHLRKRADVTSEVREFYERYHFPSFRPVEQDGLILMRRLNQFAYRWTAGEHDRPMRVLDAGCGTGNTVTGLAKQNPNVQFLGIDISEPSLAIATDAATSDGVDNVEFRRWNLLDRLPDNEYFDVVMCLGVLHHTADMATVLDNLSHALTQDGEMFLWVYGLHGRYRHLLNTRLLEMLLEAGGEADDPVSTALEFIDHAGSGMVRDDLQTATDRMADKEDVFREPTWIADQLFHPHEKLVEMVELNSLIDNAGLELSEWLTVDARPETHFTSTVLCDRFRRLSLHDRLVAIDLLLKPDRYFVLLEHAANAKSQAR